MFSNNCERDSDITLIIKNEIRELIRNNDKKNSYNIGNLIPLYAVLGEGNKALYYMSEFEKTGLHFNIFEGYNVSPLYESIRDEPEYKNIINRVNEKKTRILAQISEIERQWNH